MVHKVAVSIGWLGDNPCSSWGKKLVSDVTSVFPGMENIPGMGMLLAWATLSRERFCCPGEEQVSGPWGGGLHCCHYRWDMIPKFKGT